MPEITQQSIQADLIALESQLSLMFGLDTVTPMERENMLVRIYSLVMSESVARVLEMMDDDEVDRFNAVIDNDPSEQIVIEYLLEAVPEFPDIMEKVAFEMMDEIMSQLYPSRETQNV